MKWKTQLANWCGMPGYEVLVHPSQRREGEMPILGFVYREPQGWAAVHRSPAMDEGVSLDDAVTGFRSGTTAAAFVATYEAPAAREVRPC